eukprot:m.497728 g.497728  ORF g.497728 m.497728 type:complete len:80 (-) comp153861_c0_seq1:38-277(-)
MCVCEPRPAETSRSCPTANVESTSVHVQMRSRTSDQSCELGLHERALHIIDRTIVRHAQAFGFRPHPTNPDTCSSQLDQ